MERRQKRKEIKKDMQGSTQLHHKTKEWTTRPDLKLEFNSCAPIFQIHHGGQMYWWRKLKYPKNTTDRPVATHWQALSHNVTNEDGVMNVKNSTYHWSSVTNTPWLFTKSWWWLYYFRCLKRECNFTWCFQK